MKQRQNKFKYVLATLLLTSSVSTIFGQQTPTGAALGPFPATLGNSTRAWLRGGNTASGNGFTDNIFGTFWNSPIYTFTSSTMREVLMGNNTTTINSVPLVNNSGFMGLGSSASAQNLWNTTGPWSLLHLEGPNNTVFGGNGWRSWMKTGAFIKENSDNLYIGMKPDGIGNNYSDAVLAWGDDNTGGGSPDDLRFIFSGNAPGNGSCTNCPTNPSGFDGREAMRIAGSTGFVGIGPLFSKAPLNGLNQPKSLLHLHIENNLNAFAQFSNQNTGIGTNDGLRMGVIGDANANANGTALIYQQDARHLLFSTNKLTVATNIGAGTTNERMRVTALGTQTNLPAGGYGAYNPGAIVNTDVTRVSISHDPNQPVTRPLSLLHLGYNTGNVLNPASTDGWRPWMDVGMYVSQSTDNVYIGLKQEPNQFTTDRYDAVINWGDNNAPVGPFPVGPDNLRFIFTSTTAVGAAPAPANGADGLEVVRMTPVVSTVSGNSHGYTGIGGDPNTNQYLGGSINPTSTLEVNDDGLVATAGGSSGLRFTKLNSTSPTLANPGTGVLAVDATGKVIYVPAQAGATFGGACGNVNNMPSDWAIPMNSFNYVFSGQSAAGNRVGIGLPAGNCAPQAKLDVRMNSGVANTTSIITSNLDFDGKAVVARANGTASGTQTKVAGQFESPQSSGADQVAIYVPQSQGLVNLGFPTSNSARTQLLNVNGIISANGSLVIFSDASLKTNINGIANAYDKVKRLNGVSFEYVSSFITDTTMHGTHFGFIAQQVDTVLPEIVHEDLNGKKTMAYSEIIPYLVEALKEEHVRNDSLAAQLNNLQTQINSCCQNNTLHSQQSGGNININEVELNDAQSIVLEQNVPNPFAEQTVIPYFLPDNVMKAQMLFYNAEGKLINSVDLQGRGKGRLNVFANDLSNGIYTYTLVADGQVMDSKRMVKTK